MHEPVELVVSTSFRKRLVPIVGKPREGMVVDPAQADRLGVVDGNARPRTGRACSKAKLLALHVD